MWGSSFWPLKRQDLLFSGQIEFDSPIIMKSLKMGLLSLFGHFRFFFQNLIMRYSNWVFRHLNWTIMFAKI